MTQSDSDFTPVTNPAEMRSMLGIMAEPGGALLLLEKPGAEALPVLLMAQTQGESLLVDISTIREIAGELKRGAAFRLLVQRDGQMLRTSPLTVTESHEDEERMQCLCAYPEYLEQLHRRKSYRAQLRLGMEVEVHLREEAVSRETRGRLRNLSLDGCLVELPLDGAPVLATSALMTDLELHFPDRTRFAIRGQLRHDVTDMNRQAVLAGFEFPPLSSDQDRRLWFLVREIERETARMARERGHLLPSPLFIAPPEPEEATTTAEPAQATPTARLLARLASYLDSLTLELRQGRGIDSVQLSRHADRLLSLLDGDREALLFAVACLRCESPQVHHCLAVAVRLVDLAGSLPRDVRKALAASAMVHDLGKTLLPESLLGAAGLDESQRRELEAHVDTVLAGLEPCAWLSPAVRLAVVAGANERLDGSGYPRGRRGDELGELERLMAVVDAADALGRVRHDRPVWGLDAIYRYLIEHPHKFDTTWVKRYIRRYGLFPIGSLVRYGEGELAWVQRLDDQGRPSLVELTPRVAPYGRVAGEARQGVALARLGAPVERLAPPMP